MRSLLSPGERPNAAPGTQPAQRDVTAQPPVSGSQQPPRGDDTASMSPAAVRVLNDMQTVLRDHGIAAETAQLAHAIWAELAARPSLCRGLLAAYLLRDV